jgi:hypothetical protein
MNHLLTTLKNLPWDRLTKILNNKHVQRTTIAVCVIFLLFVLFIFSPLFEITAKKSIEHMGSKAFQTKVKIEKLDINIWKGQIEMENIKIANPKNFIAPYALNIKKIVLDTQISSLNEPIIIFQKVIIDNPEVVLEKNGTETNLKVLSNNARKDIEKNPTYHKNSKKEKTIKKIIIKELYLKEAVVLMGDNIKVSLPGIVLNDLGSSSEGQAVQEILSEVVIVLSNNSLKAISNYGSNLIKSFNFYTE